jgi:hypothetical protein
MTFVIIYLIERVAEIDLLINCSIVFVIKIVIVHTYIPLTLYPRRGSRGISNIPPRHPRFTKIS